jgi:glycosyltransferase involved in cell wall biosynthesis
LAIRILADLVERGVDALLLIVGTVTFTSRATRFDNPAYERQLHELARELDVTERVRFMGQREDVNEVLAASDLLLMASHGEPFGRVVVEAMAMGVPVVAERDGGPTEIIRHEVEGLLVDGRNPREWGDAIAHLLRQSDRRQEMGDRGRARAVHYRHERYARAVREVYAEVLGEEPRAERQERLSLELR